MNAASSASVAALVPAYQSAAFIQPTLDALTLRSLLTGNAAVDLYTGSVPNVRWGFGKLDVLAAAGALPSAGRPVAPEPTP